MKHSKQRKIESVVTKEELIKALKGEEVAEQIKEQIVIR